MPRIVILATGGTIAGAADARSHAGYNAGQISAAQLVAAVPGLETLARIGTEQIAAIGSQDMNEAVWFKLAERIDALAAQGDVDGDVDGIVVTHGTDTMEETAFFLDLIVGTSKPVVLVGAMRPATAMSADGPLNLLEAVLVALSPEAAGRGPLVVLNDTIHGARDVTKTSTTEVQAFRSPNFGPAGFVSPNGVVFFRPAGPRAPAYKLPPAPPLPRVAIIYAHAGMDATDVRAAVAAGAKGIVLAGVGDGNASRDAIAALADAVMQGVAVVRASRTGSGPVMRNIEVADDACGFAAAGFANPAKARVLLQVLLANGISSPEAVQTAFDGPI
ncbi:L-asparaginase [Aquabacter spiritensis]|uniref:L-asparaginase n=1 Tax=Aquabacter spiritensis TaxID=933073 RepID=A0A4R3LU17_9HYPH|nr:L-asparaginase [Aquabacter spiritensis]